MTRDLVSKRTRNEFREFLVGWTLREIENEFDGANIDFDRAYEPNVSGQRRTLVEQYYHSLDFTEPGDVRRLLAAYQAIIERAERAVGTPFCRDDAEHAIAHLKACLARDGLAYAEGRITAATPGARAIFEVPRTISEVTRRAIFDELRRRHVCWWGSLSEPDFLKRLYDLTSFASNDPRFASMEKDLWKHREDNLDWEDDWIYTDARLDLLGTDDDSFLRFLCELVHPCVRPDADEARALVATINKHLVVDGWELIEGRIISARPTFVARRRSAGAVILPEPVHATDVLSDEYVRELADKCDSRLASGDLDGAITVARTLLEAVLSELEVRFGGAKGTYKGDLAKQFKQVAKLLRMDDQRPDLDDRFKAVGRGLVMVANGLAPLRNKMSDGHARVRKPEAHHARMVVDAAKTVSAFLVGSYLFQVARGLRHDQAVSEEIPA